jgi:3-hydroxy-9,10-secoandrosta-1,3,5(10)-triene-9,17-dione monooxygenase reductase component
VHETGDHYVVIGRVQDLDVARDEQPLLFYRGEYRTTGG